MLYEYPEEFVVPVVYIKDLRYDPTNKYRESRCLFGGFQAEAIEDGIPNWGTILDEDTMEEHFESGTKNYPELYEEGIKKSFKSEKIPESLEDERTKNIFGMIDEEYASSEID